MRVLVLDLRGNPGGLLNVAVEIAERFIDSGLIVSTRGRAQGQTQALSANGRARWRMPLYVSGRSRQRQCQRDPGRALQDHRRATIIGRPHLWQRLGAEHLLPPLGPGRPQADDRQVLFAPQPALQRTRRPARYPHQVRSAAKPTRTARSPSEEANFGDPQLDLVLGAAIRTAKSQLHVAARVLRYPR